MKLYIPSQTEPDKDALPSHPKKVKKWLDNLPEANMGEMTRQIYTRLRQLNREKMPNKYRLEIMEHFRAPAREIFNNLNKHFINRTLPLPEKSKKIITLNQALLQEMAHGYKIIVYEAANNIDKKIDDKSLTMAICRAIMYLSELIYKASKIYAEVPEGTWYDMNQMFPYSEIKGIQNKTVKDNEHPDSKTTIEEAYKHAMLFTLARPTALRQSDTERVYNKIHNWSKLARIDSQPDRSKIDHFFCARVGEDRPPTYLNEDDCQTTGRVYTLDTSELVDTISAQISLEEEKKDRIAVGDELSLETLTSLTVSWGSCPKRRFNRAERNEHIVAAIGLTRIATIIRSGKIPGETKKPAYDPYAKPSNKLDDFSLESIPDEYKKAHRTGYLTHTEIGSNNRSGDAWDMVAKGRVLTNAYQRDNERIEETSRAKLKKEEEDIHWDIVNISAGGYCLRWNSNTTSKAQIGELIALREQTPDGRFEWRIGVIRWMQFSSTSGLEIGVQVISPRVISARVQRYNRNKEAPLECLVLPEIKPLNQPMSILLPAHAFKPGERAKLVMADEKKIGITLEERKEHTGSFTQFEFSKIDDNKKPGEPPSDTGSSENKQEAPDSDKRKDDFDEIWSSL